MSEQCGLCPQYDHADTDVHVYEACQKARQNAGNGCMSHQVSPATELRNNIPALLVPMCPQSWC